jgi:hypothetical protein
MSENNGGAATAPAFRINRVLLAVNRFASNAAIANDVETELRESRLNLPVEVVETVPGGMSANQEHFGKHIEEGDCVVTVGGDGGFRDVLSALLLPEFEHKLDNIVATTLGGGDQCDMRWSLHGQSKAAPSEIILDGLVWPLRPITWLRLSDEGARESIAFSYIGHGWTAEGAGLANRPDFHNRSKLIREADLALDVLADDTTFRCEWLGGVAVGTTEVLGDLSIFAGPRMAGRFHPQSRHWDAEQRHYVVRTGPGIADKLLQMGGLAAGLPVGTLTDQPLDFKVYGDTRVHFDGEGPIDVPFGSEIIVDRHPTEIKLLYSRHMLPPRNRPPQ